MPETPATVLGGGPNPVNAMAPLERVNIAGLDVFINPQSMTYTITTRTMELDTQGGVVYQLGPEKPVELTWAGETTKNSIGTVMRLKNIWRHQQKKRDTVRYVNPMRGEDFEVIITSVTYTESWEKPWRWTFGVNFVILGDLSNPSLAGRSMNPSDMNMGQGDFNTARTMVSGGQTNITAQSADTFAGMAQAAYGSRAFAGYLRSYNAQIQPNSVSPTGEPIPGATIAIPNITETDYANTTVADYYGQSGTALDRESTGADALKAANASIGGQKSGLGGIDSSTGSVGGYKGVDPNEYGTT